ncbi:hypothetical protein ACLOJK_009187 [Asimina triloba]
MAFSSSLLYSPRFYRLLRRTSPIPSPFFSSSTSPATPYPLQYELVASRPSPAPLSSTNRHRKSQPQNPSTDSQTPISDESLEASGGMDKSKRKYYLKRRKRMLGSDDDDDRLPEDKYVELKPEVVELPTLHAREEELYFYDALSYPWEKEKHYRMVYQLEKKYFPDQCLDRAFVEAEPAKEKTSRGSEEEKTKKKKKKGEKDGDELVDQKMVFFEEESGVREAGPPKKVDVSEKKVEELFKCLKKVPSAGEVSTGEPFVSTRKTGLPPRWDGPNGTMVLVNKPKGQIFKSHSKMVKVVKWMRYDNTVSTSSLVEKIGNNYDMTVGHAGTLDPMATGLLIVCVGKATKMVERYQGMIKGYSGVFRLGEATSTWDADSPVILREPWERIKDEDIKKTATSFRGEIWQVGGEKMYEKARKGEMVELVPRRISIYQFDIERSLDDRQNLIFRVTCSKGTYIRSLCADFGKALGRGYREICIDLADTRIIFLTKLVIEK